MKRLMLTAAALALLTTAVQADDPATNILYNGKTWITYATKTQSGVMTCGMLEKTPNATLDVKYFYDSGIFLKIYNDYWSIPKDTKITGYMMFDSKKFPLVGVGGTDKTGRAPTGYVTYKFKPGTEAAANIITLFEEASRLVFGFDQGLQAPITFGVDGAAVGPFRRCVTNLDKANAEWANTLAQATPLSALGSLAMPASGANADEPSRETMLKGLIVFSTYSRFCTTPPPGKLTMALIRYTLERVGKLDEDLLNLNVNTFKSLIFENGGLDSWCRKTADDYQQRERDIEAKAR